MINCVIIDDEPLAREGIASYVNDVSFLSLIATCESAVEYSKWSPQQPVDLIFLDIQLPKITGLDFLKVIRNPPMVIITTAYSEYALEGFQLNVLDYLLKPVTFDRFFKSVHKAKDYYHLLTRSQTAASSPASYFFIKCGTKYEKIYFDEVLFVEGLQNYITIYTSKGKYITMHSLKMLEEAHLNNEQFIRVHKSYMVAVNKIESIQGNEIFIGAHRVPISRNYREQVLQQVVMNKLWDKSK
ncbi:DNA-binding response regulator [Niastella yeongjuensis]|uniref:DNA-binding response regulator n=1 Tax=Niastella yeongjuensis TaxID=354355 RepID=A0A1V9EFA7_9BACT|nr:LytTR family DNA-binding domain-containing protein [Niastella yeongjuensis]OQP44803.1 DNA-binding response regulator [Niastella yeongjuensis]SEP42296.1 two component transcriptional regulator, LytTR family [Niastella yeongjuensis]